MAKVSVLMPVFNAEKFLAQAIDSVLSQTFDDFEFLILDDGSTDSSVSIVNSYQDQRIKFYKNPENLGISRTLNRGIQLATTPLIARMDSDDICHPDRLAKQFAYMESQPDCGMVSCLVRVVDEDLNFVRTDDFKSEYFYYNLTFICWIYHPTVMFRKNVVEEVGMYQATYSEDFELFWQISRNYKIHNLPEILLDYRISSQSLHQVLKKKEYDVAQYEQLQRNLQYYCGKNYTLPVHFIDALQHNFGPMLKRGSAREVIRLLEELDFITKKILEVSNVNLDKGAVEMAALYKRKFILNHFLENLPTLPNVMLRVLLGNYKAAIRYLFWKGKNQRSIKKTSV